MSAAREGWTFGAEHEFGDWAYNEPLPEGFGRDVRDFTCMSSNGVANDPKGISYAYGGEINTPPTPSAAGQGGCVTHLRSWWADRGLPAPTVNHRSNLHIHVRVPGLRDDLAMLKHVQAYIHLHMPAVLRVIQPLHRPAAVPITPELQGAQRRWRRRRASHQTLLTAQRLSHQLAAETLEEFFAREVPQSRGRPQWHLQPRLCVNLRQLRDTDTVEFRHFAGTLDPFAVSNCAHWCEEFLLRALDNCPEVASVAAAWALERPFPTFPEYDHRLECRYRATCHDGTLKRAEIERNIDLILRGEFD